MLDSIFIKIEKFYIADGRYFQKGSLKTITDKSGNQIVPLSKQVCSFAEIKKKSGQYFPEIHTEQRFKERHLCVQVSVPKLLFGTNLYDVNESMLPDFVKKLQAALREAGVEVSEEAIANAIVARVDFSKVINLTGICTANFCLKVLENFNYKSRHEFSHWGYFTKGKMLKFYSKAQSLKFYDKLAEVRSKGYTSQEIDLIKQLQNRTTEIIKIENSLQTKQTVSRVLGSYYKQKRTDWKLKEIFNNDLAKHVLNKQADSILDSPTANIVKPTLLDQKDLQLQIKNHIKRYDKQLQAIGALEKIKSAGLASFLKELKDNNSPATYYRQKNMVHALTRFFKLNPNAELDVINFILKQLREFNLLTPANHSITKTNLSIPKPP